MPLPTLVSAVYRLRRYHTAKVGNKVETIGFSGLSCTGCTDELKRERGCHLPGFSYRSEVVWRIDYHEPLTERDRSEFCPASLLVLAAGVVKIVDDALEIQEAGGVATYSGTAPSNLPSWYNEGYRLVIEAKNRVIQEAEARTLALAAQSRREYEAKNQLHGWKAKTG